MFLFVESCPWKLFHSPRVFPSLARPSLQVCSTLSFAGSGVFARMSRPFDVNIIDEAAQAVSAVVLLYLEGEQFYLIAL